MSEVLSYPAEGITSLVVEKMSGDSVLRGLSNAGLIEATVTARSEFVLEGDVLRLEGRAERVVVPDHLPVRVEEARGDLRVQGLSGPIELGQVHGDLRLDRLTGPVVVDEANGDLRIDGSASVTLRHGCSGDLRFSGGGSLTCENVGGDLRINDSSDLKAAGVHGDMWVERLSGALAVSRAGGDARISEVGGPVTLEQLSGDLRGAALVGGLAASGVHGDVLLHGPYPAEAGYTVTADGDVSLHLSEVDNVRLTVRASGRIRADLPLVPTADGTPTYTATVGSGAVPVVLSAGGDLRIARAGAPSGAQFGGGWERKRGAGSDGLPDLSELGERIRRQVSASLASAGINLETGEVNLGRSRSGRAERFWRGPTPPAPPPGAKGPTPPKAAASDKSEETLTILRLVEEGRITPEEADKLLRALGA